MIFISAGHSNVDPGAVATYTIKRDNKIHNVTRKESDIAVEFRNMVSFYLTRAGVAHAVDGRALDNMPLRDAAAFMRKSQMGMEFHCNAAANVNASGCEVLCAPKDAVIADKICKAISSTLGIRNRGVKPENSGQHSKLAFVQAGGMIVELFFLSNATDLAKYDERKWLAARAVANVMIPQ